MPNKRPGSEKFGGRHVQGVKGATGGKPVKWKRRDVRTGAEWRVVGRVRTIAQAP